MTRYTAPATMYSVYLLCWYTSTNADAGGGAGLFDTQFCNDNSECGSGECTYMAMNSYLQISSNGGQVRKCESTNTDAGKGAGRSFLGLLLTKPPCC